jgi:uncharacterized repeat protein (TIGR04138 family)
MQLELLDLALKDGRYAWEAYEFALEAIAHATRMFGKDAPGDGETAGPEHHVTGRELLESVCDLARREFGLMAPVVFDIWGVRTTDDVGEIMFTMVGAGILFKTDSDRKEDYHDVFALEPALTEGYRISTDEPDHGRSGR